MDTGSAKQRRGARQALLLVTAIAAVAVAALVTTKWGLISDTWRASQFTPTAEVSSVLEKMSLTSDADRVMRASAPQISDASEFNSACASVDHSESAQVIGCFNGETIHLFRISDERLRGMVEVTAAHELLHAVWQRLSTSEREELAELLTAEYEAHTASDTVLQERMSVYVGLDPLGFANELHSVFGTEVTSLSPALEAHYQKYFIKRSDITALFNGYNGFLTELEQQRSELNEQLTQLQASIEARKSSYEMQLERFRSAVDEFNRRNENFEFSGQPAEFARQRSALVSWQTQLEQARAALNDEVSRYNLLRDQLIELDVTAAELYDAISSEKQANSNLSG